MKYTILGFLVLCSAEAQTLVIPQVADGGGWQTTIVLTNTSTSAASASLSFFQEAGAGTTQNWNLGFLEASSAQSLSIPAAGTVLLHTPGTAGSTTVGWGQLQGSSSIVAYAIFTERVLGKQDQDGTANAAVSASRFLVPFDNTNGSVTAVAIANPSGSAQSIAIGVQPTGEAGAAQTPINLAANGHMSFALPQQFAVTNGKSGLAEFYSANGNIAVLALRFNNTGAFTTAPVYSETGSPIIGATGGGSEGGGSTLPAFSMIDFFANATLTNVPVVDEGSITPLGNGGPCGAGSASGADHKGLVYQACWNSLSISGNTFTLTGIDPQGSSMFGNGGAAAITSGTLTITLSPQGLPTIGDITGSITVTSLLGTVSGSFTGTYSATLLNGPTTDRAHAPSVHK